MNLIEPNPIHHWKLPVLYCKCQKQQSPALVIKKCCIEPGCEENSLFAEDCICVERHIASHPHSVFE